MTDLTEKWKKGELEKGYYYIEGIKKYEGINVYWIGYPIHELERRWIKEVLAPVPTYNEYLDSEAHCAVYSEENKELRQLLKECIPLLNSHPRKFKLKYLLTSINAAIGESEER